MPSRKVPLRATSRLDLVKDVAAHPIVAKSMAPRPVPGPEAGKRSVGSRFTWLGDMLTPERNSLGVMRLILALVVLISHSVYLTTGDASLEPLYRFTNYTLGQHGVQVFFVLSGILVAQSLYQSGSVRDYATARALRVFPALIVCVLATALIIGPWLTTLTGAQYLKDVGVAAYIVKTISLISGSATLPELFQSNPVARVVNTSVWTLKYEVMCYAILAVVGWIAIKTNQWRAVSAVAIVVWLAAVLYKPTGLELHGGAKSSIEVLRYFTIFFGTGAAAFVLRRFIPIHAALLVPLGAMFAFAIGGRFQEFAAALFLGYAALWMSTFRFGPMRDFSNGNDYSYATYLFHMPVAQALLHFWPEMHAVPLILATAGIVIWLAYLSWELIERPALSLRHRLWAPASHSTEPTFDASMATASATVASHISTPEPVAVSKEVAAKAVASARAAERLVREMAAAQAAAKVVTDVAAVETQARSAGVKLEPGLAQVWRPMPSVKKLKIHVDELPVAAVDTPTLAPTVTSVPTHVAAQSQLIAAPSRFAKSIDRIKKATATQPILPSASKVEAPQPRVSASRIAFATKRRPATDGSNAQVVLEPAIPSEPTRAVVAMRGDSDTDSMVRPRAVQPRPAWSRPLRPSGPLSA